MPHDHYYRRVFADAGPLGRPHGALRSGWTHERIAVTARSQGGALSLMAVAPGQNRYRGSPSTCRSCAEIERAIGLIEHPIPMPKVARATSR